MAENNRVVVLCKSKSEEAELFKYLHSLGYKWRSNTSLLGTSMFIPPATCYDFDDKTKWVMYCTPEFYQSRGEDIIDYDDFWCSVTEPEPVEEIAKFLDMFSVR